MIPLTLISGFLGAGKTTFLTRLLELRSRQLSLPSPNTAGIPNFPAAQGKLAGKLAVVVNEFAELGLDGARLPGGDYEKYELNRGSIFCICLRTDFIALLEKIVSEIRPDEIWVESTGVADVSEVFKMLSVPSLRAALFLRTHVCIVDPNTILKVLTTLRAAAEQVRLADALILNKVDTVSSDALHAVEAKLKQYNRRAPILRADHAAVDPAAIPSFSIPRFDARGTPGHAPQPVVSVSITEPWVIPFDAFERWWRAQGGDLWRVKGQLTSPDGARWMDGTIGRLESEALAAPAAVPSPTSLAFVGMGINDAHIRAALQELSVK